MHEVQLLKQELGQAQEWLSKEYSQIHTGRAAPALLDGVMVEASGATQPLKNVASISIEDPKTLRVVPWDKGQIKDIERALYASDLGFSIAVDDAGIRAITPMLTADRRTQLVKVAKQYLEDARITVRKARESALTAIKDAKLPEDTFTRGKDEVQKLVDGANVALDALFKKKEAEILQ